MHNDELPIKKPPPITNNNIKICFYNKIIAGQNKY